MTNSMKKRLNKRGFTLVELIVVIAIVAVLAVVGIPAIAGQVAKANQSAAAANARTIASSAAIIATEEETKGSTAAEILTAITGTGSAPSARVMSAAGVKLKTGQTAAITTTPINNDATPAVAISHKVTSVKILKGTAVLGEWAAS